MSQICFGEASMDTTTWYNSVCLRDLKNVSLAEVPSQLDTSVHRSAARLEDRHKCSLTAVRSFSGQSLHLSGSDSHPCANVNLATDLMSADSSLHVCLPPHIMKTLDAVWAENVPKLGLSSSIDGCYWSVLTGLRCIKEIYLPRKSSHVKSPQV